MNLYEYARSNPIKLSDPSGTAPPPQQQEIRIIRPEELPQGKAIEIGPGGKVEFRDLTPAEIEQGRAEVEKANRQFSEDLFKSLAEPRETPRQRERRERDVRIKAKQQAGEPLFPAQGTGQAPGRVANTDEYGNYSPYLQAVNETRALYGPDAGPIPGGPADPLIGPIVQEGGPAGDKVFGAFVGAGLQKGGFLRTPTKTPVIVRERVESLDKAGPVAPAGQGGGRRFWIRKTEFSGIKVYQRDDLIDTALVDARGRTNLERMQKGLAPVGPDGKPLELHHVLQTTDGPIAEVTSKFHRENRAAIHINPSSIPSGIDRAAFNRWRVDYWKARARDFQ